MVLLHGILYCASFKLVRGALCQLTSATLQFLFCDVVMGQ